MQSLLPVPIRAGDAPRSPGQPGVLGYLYNHGGLNNQKMALIGLIMHAVNNRQDFSLPYISIRDQRSAQEHLVRFEHVFSLEPVLSFARRHGINVQTGTPAGERGGWEYFFAFDPWTHDITDPHQLATFLDAVGTLRPLIATHPAVTNLRNFVLGPLGIRTVVQLRIEADWQEHYAANLANDAEDNGLGFAGIMTKLRATFPDLRMIYATADEASLPAPRQEIRAACRERFGIELVWKTDLLPAAFCERLTPLDLSLIDFDIARASPRFVGLTRSTFANMLAIEKFAASRKPVRGHYIYNLAGDRLVERQDNGFRVMAAAAAQPTGVEALLAAI